MPRPPRPQFANARYHITTRGNRGSAIFMDVDDRRTFTHLLRRVITRKRWRCHAFCLMTTHYHLLVTTPEPNVAAGMQWLNSMHAQLFNERRAYRGHVFQGRYHSALIESDEHLVEAYRYIALNPVRAGLCRRPPDWPWSSVSRVIDTTVFPSLDVTPIAAHFGEGWEGLLALRRFVETMDA